MDEDYLPDLTDQESIAMGEIDLAMEEAIREMDDSLPDLDPTDRTLVILYMRWAYIDGHADGYEEGFEDGKGLTAGG